MKIITTFCMIVVLTLAIIIPSNAFSLSDSTVFTPYNKVSAKSPYSPSSVMFLSQKSIPSQSKLPTPTSSPTSTPTSIPIPTSTLTPTSTPTVPLTISSAPTPLITFNLPNETYQITVESGYVDVTINSTKKIKILIETPSGAKIWLVPTAKSNLFYNRIWLTHGIGKYTVSVMENLHENSYSYLKSLEVINTAIIDKDLLPAKEIESDSPEIIALARSITQGASTDSEKSIRIYNWVSINIVYDLPKFVRMGKNDYSMPFGALSALQTRRGVCYDYSTLYAALGRASGVKVKVIAGNYHSGNQSLYHAWNEVYISELSSWISLDTSMAFIYKKSFYNNLDTVNVYEKTEDL